MLNTEPRPVRRTLISAPLRHDDATLVRRAQTGDERAFAAIFERHHPPLLSYCRHMLGDRDDGEDALQQAFIKAHRGLLGGTTPRDLRPWLYAIARNCCLSAIAARRPTAPLEDRMPALAGLSDEVRRREDLRELFDGIGRLPEDQRSALLLAELDDLSHQAIATVVGCPVSRVKALIYQARSALIADRDARETPCQEIREQLAVARGGELRRGPLRRHLNLCSGCRDFQFAVGAQRQSLAALLPVAPSAGLMAAILGHGSAHAAGVAGVGGAGAGATSAGGAAGTSVGVTSAGAAVTGASGLATSGTAAAGAAAGAGAGTGAGTSVGALVGGGLVTKLAVGGAVVALAAAGTVATRQRPSAARTSRLAGAQIAAFTADRSGVAASGGPSDASYDSAASIAAPGTGLSAAPAQESATALGDTSGPGALASVDPFTSPTSGAGAQGLLTPTGTSPSNVALTAVPRQLLMVGKGTVDEGSVAQARNARARKLRAKLRREALRRRALRLREARRRARLRKERRKALRRRHPVVAKKPVKAPEPAPTPVTPAPVRTRHRHALPSSTSLDTAGTGAGSENTQTTKVKRRPSATSTSGGSTTTTGTDPQTSTTGTGSGKGKTSSPPSGGEKTGSTDGVGKSGAATGAEKSGSASAKGKTGSGVGSEKSGSTTGSKETGTDADTGTSHDGGPGGRQAGDSESGSGAAGTGKTGDSSEQSNAATHKSQASGAGTTNGKGSASSAKKHLVEEEQLPNL